MSEQLTFIPALEAAKLAGVTKETIRNLCKAGTLRYQMRGHSFYPCKDDVEKYSLSISEVNEIEQTVEEYKQQLNQLSEQLRDAQLDVQARLEAINMFPEKIRLINGLLCAIIPHFDKDLNPREIEVAVELLQGGRISETAEKLHLTRARVLQIYDKIVRKLEIFPDESIAKNKTIAEQQKTIESLTKTIRDLEKKYDLKQTIVTPEIKVLLDTPIREAGFSTRVCTSLVVYGHIETIRDLIKYPRKDLFNLRNFGQKCIDEVDQFLAAHNLSFEKA